MATKTKAAAKSPAAAKKPAKAAAKKPAAKPAAKAAAKKPLAKSSAKPAAKAAPRPVAKAAPKPAAKAAPAKGAPVKAAPAKAETPKSTATKPSNKLSTKAASHSAANSSTPVPAAPATSPLPPPKPAVRPTQAVSDKEIASAHEYLLTRMAGRSGAPVVVDGRSLLTEEQLLSMPESDYMNSEQLAYFRYRLQEIERELLSNADETTEHLRETVIVPDPADRATIEEEHALELRTRDRERKLLKKVQGSLAQIDSGEYGYCEETGEPIGIPRLLARPTATLSLEAQQRREIKQKLFGD
jgi:DnaK suppressor protein